VLTASIIRACRDLIIPHISDVSEPSVSKRHWQTSTWFVFYLQVLFYYHDVPAMLWCVLHALLPSDVEMKIWQQNYILPPARGLLRHMQAEPGDHPITAAVWYRSSVRAFIQESQWTVIGTRLKLMARTVSHLKKNMDIAVPVAHCDQKLAST
jgi:hypothetical protein